MSAASEHRYLRFVRRQTDATARSHEWVLIDDLNALPKHECAPTPFGPILFLAGHGGWWAECPTTGKGYWYSTLRHAVKSWSVTITEYRCGGFWGVTK